MNKELPIPITRNESISLDEKPTFEACISRLPEEINDEIVKINEYLLHMNSIKFKRKVEQNKISYVSSENGFSYSMFISNNLMRHSLNWYVIHNNKYKEKEQDHMIHTLHVISNKNPDFAQKMFHQIRECVGGGCMDTKLYEFQNEKKVSCNGRIEFTMRREDFCDVKTFIDAVAELVENQALY